MTGQTKYGDTLFLDGFQAGASAKPLKRVHFLKNASQSALYDEAWLQHLIMDHPSLLPVDQIEPAFTSLVPICVELPMRRSGYLDNLLVTPAGDLALIECKLWRNPQARREVIAQIIDYAQDLSTWTYDTLQDAISQTKPLDASDDQKTRRLYELVSAKGVIDEASFHDNVSRNLKRGRFLLLIVGDGIREGVDEMAEFLQQYAGIHFTLGIVDLALFEVPTGGYIAQPRVLARTTNIDRGIVTLHEGRIAIGPPSMGSTTATNAGRRTTITQELYFEQLERIFPGISIRLNAFIDSVATHHVSPDFGTDSMILRWRPDDSKSWNLGTITSSGQVFLDYLGQQAKNAALLGLHRQYLTTLAALIPGADVKETPKEVAWYVRHEGKYVTVGALLADETRKEGWVRAIAEFQAAVTKASQVD